MKILIGHDRYQQRAGEDAVFDAESQLLRSKGHEVILFEDDNLRIGRVNPVKLALDSIWSRDAYRELTHVIQETRPDLCHFHNVLPLFSNSVLEAARDEGIPVVQTLHNYRALCPVATFFRDDQICELCAPKTLQWPAVRHACYRDSRTASSVIAAKHVSDKRKGTWNSGADIYVALTEFMREKYIEYGFPAAQIVVKPNFLEPDPGAGPGSENTFIFAGRLVEEKGIRILLEIWSGVPENTRLLIAGEGPLREQVERSAHEAENIDYLGSIPFAELLDRMKNAAMLVFPSIWYEGFPRTIVEAYAVGLPVLAFRIGGMASIVQPGETGMLVDIAQPEGFRAAVAEFRASKDAQERLRKGARRAFEEEYTREENYQQLMAIYESALKRRSGSAVD